MHHEGTNEDDEAEDKSSNVVPLLRAIHENTRHGFYWVEFVDSQWGRDMQEYSEDLRKILENTFGYYHNDFDKPITFFKLGDSAVGIDCTARAARFIADYGNGVVQVNKVTFRKVKG